MLLEERFEKFMLSLNTVEGIDFIELSEKDRRQKKADYLAMDRQIVIEQKCINQDQANKIQEEMEKFSMSDDYPFFYGERDINLVLDKLPNKDEIKRSLYTKVTKLLEQYLRQANKQIESTEKTFNLTNTCGILVILNEKVKVLSPEIVAARIQQRLREKNSDGPRFSNINYVVFISETHNLKGRPVVQIIEGSNASHTSSLDYIKYLIHSWAHYNGGDVVQVKNVAETYGSIKENSPSTPEKMSRSDARRYWYQTNRYMKYWDDQKVVKEAALFLDYSKPLFMKNAPKVSPKQLLELTMKFSDFIEESNIRGLDIKEFKKYQKR
ncbi:hypothetical protein KO519_21015 [Paraglaciecola agarilytica]|uniref:hypothetical protein n=1 Tax=Paraglaciecola chathamensis TaxID=368405 RepID=UPI001C098250|nr:hypothetical protein [Paraglaciecola agarilytica]MBU3020159.1 hypothetical protein [Paraglaciecola agarilytica]